MPTNRVYRIAVIPGDGIGKEVVPEGVRVLEAAAKKFGFELRQDDFDFASYDYYAKYQRMMPEDWKEKIGRHDAIFFGAVGWPAKIPDHVSLWGSLIQFRREFDQYVNLRPVRLRPGVPTPLANPKAGTSTSGWCAKTPKANTRPSAAASSPAPSARWSYRKPCSRASASTAC
jgi:tartrate dehydrogenase/decarboxylase/D-malate dehydrogenase